MNCTNPRPRKTAAAGFPDDALVEILSRLPVRPLHRSKIVAKAWRDLVDDPLLRKKLPQTLEGFLIVDEEIYAPAAAAGDDQVPIEFIRLLVRSVPLEIDPAFSFLMKQPGMDTLTISDSCNGLLLFKHSQRSDPFSNVVGYFVCNPATAQWAAVPTCGCPPPYFLHSRSIHTYLAFDPAVSSHFHLVQFFTDSWYDLQGRPFVVMEQGYGVTVHIYSSETGTWSHGQNEVKQQLEGWRHKGMIHDRGTQSTFVNGMLHLLIVDQSERKIVAVDTQGKTRKVIPLPAMVQGRCWPLLGHVAQSQGRLHYINQEYDDDSKQSCELSIWVLVDYDGRKWVLKHTVAFQKLFGKKNCIDSDSDFRFIGIHPDCNVVFFAEPDKEEVISYDMDREEVSVVSTFENYYWRMRVVPYVPFFRESLALTNKS